jgi:hypothetical protein
MGFKRFYTTNKEIARMGRDELAVYARSQRDSCLVLFFEVCVIAITLLIVSDVVIPAISINYENRIDALKTSMITLGEHICGEEYGESFTNFRIVETGEIQMFCHDTYTTVGG